MTRLTVERLREVLDYSPETGVFRWRVATGRRIRVGDVAGTCSREHGYRVIQIDGKLYKAHRLAWVYVNEFWPADEIDHINLDRADNRLLNLREATRSQNMMNQRAPKTNTSGFKGVSPHGNGFSAQIYTSLGPLRLGHFQEAEHAAAAYRIAAAAIHGDFARVS